MAGSTYMHLSPLPLETPLSYDSYIISYFLSIYHVAVLSVFTDGILNAHIRQVTIPSLQMKELNHQCLRNLPKFSQLINGRARIQTQAL